MYLCHKNQRCLESLYLPKKYLQLSIYPLNIFLHGAGVVFWSIAGYITQDKPVLANFGLQIPLFAVGFTKVLFGF